MSDARFATKAGAHLCDSQIPIATCVSQEGGREDIGDVSAKLESRKGLAKGGEWVLDQGKGRGGCLVCKHLLQTSAKVYQ